MNSNIIMKPPIPPIGDGAGEIIKKIIKVANKLMGIFKKPSKDAGETESINDNSSLENIERISQIFIDFKEQVHTRAVDVEQAVADEVSYYVEELHDILSDNNDKVVKYGIHIKRIERQIDRIALRVKGTIDNALSKKVSLDNAECKEIVKMIPGAKKETAMNAFLARSVSSALEACCTEIHESLEEIYDDVKTEIVGAVESIQKQNEYLQENFSSIDENDYETTAKKQMVDACFLIDACDMIFEML